MTTTAIPVGTEVLYTLSQIAYLDSTSPARLLSRVVSADSRFADATFVAAGKGLLDAMVEAMENPAEHAAFAEHNSQLSSVIRDATAAGTFRGDTDEVQRLLVVLSPSGTALLRLVEADWLAVAITQAAESASKLASEALAAERGFVVRLITVHGGQSGLAWDGATAWGRLSSNGWVVEKDAAVSEDQRRSELEALLNTAAKS